MEEVEGQKNERVGAFRVFASLLPPTNTHFSLEVGSLFLSLSEPKVHIMSVPRLEAEKEDQKSVRKGRSELAMRMACSANHRRHRSR